MNKPTRVQLRYALVKNLWNSTKCTDQLELKLARYIARNCMAQNSGWPWAMAIEVGWTMRGIRAYRRSRRAGDWYLHGACYKRMSSRPARIYGTYWFRSRYYRNYLDAVRASKQQLSQEIHSNRDKLTE